MKSLSTPQIVLLAIGGVLMFTFPPAFIAYVIIVAVGFIAKHLVIAPEAAAEAAEADSSVQETYSHLGKYLRTNTLADNGETAQLSDTESSTWEDIVQSLRSDESK